MTTSERMCISTDLSSSLTASTTTKGVVRPLRPSLTKNGSSRRTYRYGERSSKTNAKSVSFGTIESKTFETIRGHSKLDTVYPISLGWNCVEQMAAVSVDQYEKERPSEDRPTSEDLITSPKERRKMIKSAQLKNPSSKTTTTKLVGLPSKVLKLIVLPTKMLQPGRAA